MADELERLETAARDFETSDDDYVDLRRLSVVINRLLAKQCRVADRARRRGEHLVAGQGAATWIANQCLIAHTTAGDRLCVGAQLQHLPRIAEALGSGEIGYQAAAVVCHLSEQVGDEKRQYIDEDDWVSFSKRFSIREMRYLAAKARHAWDAEGFEKDTEEDYDNRYLHISELGGMYRIDGMLDPEGGAAFKAAIESLATPRGERDFRSNPQRRADAAVEMARHALDEGRLPRRNSVRPHINVNTTLEALKGEVGAAASELDSGMPISSKTVQRLACDGTLCRILKADSIVVDVGRATRAISPAQWRALKARHRTCGWPGCDRPINWTNPHHIEFWSRNGKTDLRNLVPLCYYHHRLVHEGGWQVVWAGESLAFIAPERPLIRRIRG
ncbi:MAG TPA: DUF222 domain-containing protein, partial [Candidatus Dormibacteraeota bacterium]|nr:DUF222 domain-containing protein [Candidatus Dormibacteraeota bacterium]